ncbi:hypothetical protein IJT93_04555 [bacterium]|nr:hypothetical protein [bacterium]
MKNYRPLALLFILYFLSFALLPAAAADPEDKDFPELEHVILLDCSGSMSEGTYTVSGTRYEGGAYGSYVHGFSDSIAELLKGTLVCDSAVLKSEAACIPVPACSGGSFIEERIKKYQEGSSGMQLGSLYDEIRLKDGSRAKYPGPHNDGAMGDEGLKSELQRAVNEADARLKGNFICYWFLTDNAYNSPIPTAYLDYITHEETFKEVLFVPLGTLKDGRCGLALYVIVQQKGTEAWKPEWSEKLRDTLNKNLESLGALWSQNEKFLRRAIDLHGVIEQNQNGEDKTFLKAQARQLSYCALPDYHSSDEAGWYGLSQNRELVLQDNAQYMQGAPTYSYAASVQSEIRPSSGWFIRNIEVYSQQEKQKNLQDYSVEAASLTDDEKHILSEGLKIDFSELKKLNKVQQNYCDKYGSVFVRWLFHADPQAAQVLKNHPEGAEIRLHFELPTTIDFSKIDSEKLQSGFHEDILKCIANTAEVEKYLLQAQNEGEVIKRSWTSDKPITFKLLCQSQPPSAMQKLKALLGRRSVQIALGAIIAALAAFIVCKKSRSKKAGDRHE